MTTQRRIFTATLLAAMFLTRPASADDWPHWMGPERDNVWRETGLLERFPEGGPTIRWRTPIASGYTGPSVADGRVFVMDFVSEEDVDVSNFSRNTYPGTERVLCLDQSTGKILWKHEYPVTTSVSYPAGPRCTPAVDGDRVYTLGAEGNLFAFEAASGKILWSRDLRTEYAKGSPLWGYAAHPLIDGQKLLTLAGGEGSHVVALDKLTGKEIWKSGSSKSLGYSPPTIIEFGGTRQLILLKPDAVSSVDPESGKEYWSVPYEATQGSIIMSPVLTESFLYVGGYRGKNLLLQLADDRPAAEIVWRDRRRMLSPINVQPMVVDGVMYGLGQRGVLSAIRLPLGEGLWTTEDVLGRRPKGNDTAFLVREDDRFWLFNELGELIIARLSPEGYEEIDRAKVIEPTGSASGREVVWCMPAFAGRCAFIRNDVEILCVDLSAEAGGDAKPNDDAADDKAKSPEGEGEGKTVLRSVGDRGPSGDWPAVGGSWPDASLPPLSDAGRLAFDVLVNATRFTDAAIGVAGILPHEVAALRILHREPEAGRAFALLCERGTIAGRLFGLCGLWYWDPDRFGQETAALLRDHADTEVSTMRGCIVADLPVRGIVRSPGEVHTVRLASRTQTCKEWFAESSGGKSAVYDIVGGGFPCVLRSGGGW